MSTRCKFCGEPLSRRGGERLSDFAVRKSCGRSCHTAWKNAKPIWQTFAEMTAARENGCIEWTGYRDPKGYGRFTTLGGEALAHRTAYRLHYGADAGEMHVLHRCDNPACVNPHHLFLGTNQDNVDDRTRKGRSAAMFGRDNPNWRHGKNCASRRAEEAANAA